MHLLQAGIDIPVIALWLGHESPLSNHIYVEADMNMKMAALHAHASQTAHNKELENMVREWGQRNAGMGGLPDGRIAEAFKIVHTN